MMWQLTLNFHANTIHYIFKRCNLKSTFHGEKKAFSLLWCTKENGHGLGLGTVVSTRKFQNTHRSAL